MRQAPSDTLEGRAWLQQKPSPVPQIEVPEGLKLETAQENNSILWFCLLIFPAAREDWEQTEAQM